MLKVQAIHVFFGVMCCVQCCSVASFAQMFSNLHGTKLELVESLTVLGTLQDVGKEAVRFKLEQNGLKEARISSVTVSDDYLGRISLTLDYISLAEEVYLFTEVLDANKRPIRSIRPILSTMTSGGKPIDLNLCLDERSLSNTLKAEITSAYIRFTLIYPLSKKFPFKEVLNELVEARASKLLSGLGAFGLSTTYKLPKNWRSQLAVTKPKMLRATLVPLGNAKYITATPWALNSPTKYASPAVSSSKSKGPSSQPISLWEKISGDVKLDSPEDISAISLVLYPDRDPQSRVYYYVPNALQLLWNQEQGYEMLMSYEGQGQTDEGHGDVSVAATLGPGITRTEVETVYWLLKSYLSEKNGVDPVLQPIPLAGTPEISLSLGSMYQISSEKISIVAGSTPLDPVEVDWKVDSKTKDDMDVLLKENLGIRGAMRLTPLSDSMYTLQIPVRISLSDPRVFGKFDLSLSEWRGKPWKNPTPYPMQLLRMHRLVIKTTTSGLQPTILSWDLGKLEVPVNGQVTFLDQTVPIWLDRTEYTKRQWLEYRIVPCRECDEAVFNVINSGTLPSTKVEIYFESMGIIAATGAKKLEVTIRSYQARRDQKYLTKLPAVSILEDEQRVLAGYLYVLGGKEPNFEYKLKLITEDMVYDSMVWMKSNEQSVYLNKKQMEEVFGVQPGLE